MCRNSTFISPDFSLPLTLPFFLFIMIYCEPRKCSLSFRVPSTLYLGLLHTRLENRNWNGYQCSRTVQFGSHRRIFHSHTYKLLCRVFLHASIKYKHYWWLFVRECQNDGWRHYSYWKMQSGFFCVKCIKFNRKLWYNSNDQLEWFLFFHKYIQKYFKIAAMIRTK